MTQGLKRDQGLAISQANEALIRSCGLVVANMTPFRGLSLDVGTAYEVDLLRANSNRQYSETQRAKRWCGRVSGMGDRNEGNPMTNEDRKWWVWLDPSLGMGTDLVVRGYFEDHVAELLTIDRERLIGGRDGSLFVLWIEKVTDAEIQRTKKLLGPLIHPQIVWEVRQGESPVWATDGNPLKESMGENPWNFPQERRPRATERALRRPQVDLVGGLHDGDPLDYLLAGDAQTRLADAHAIFGRTIRALRQAGYDQAEIDCYTSEALGVTAYEVSDYPRLLCENYERLVRATAKWVEIR